MYISVPVSNEAEDNVTYTLNSFFGNCISSTTWQSYMDSGTVVVVDAKETPEASYAELKPIAESGR